jgi:hypothetical protein
MTGQTSIVTLDAPQTEAVGNRFGFRLAMKCFKRGEVGGRLPLLHLFLVTLGAGIGSENLGGVIQDIAANTISFRPMAVGQLKQQGHERAAEPACNLGIEFSR